MKREERGWGGVCVREREAEGSPFFVVRGVAGALWCGERAGEGRAVDLGGGGWGGAVEGARRVETFCPSNAAHLTPPIHAPSYFLPCVCVGVVTGKRERREREDPPSQPSLLFFFLSERSAVCVRGKSGGALQLLSRVCCVSVWLCA